MQPRYIVALILVALAAHTVSGCSARVRVPGFEIKKSTWRSEVLQAGVGRVDITPPPGYPTGGHGPAGNMARGYWTRLYARAFFFIDPDGNTLVLVSCDLFAIPGGLSAKVAQLVGPEWGMHEPRIVIPPKAIIIAATHTHQGAGNYMTAAAYNEYGSKYPGFSPEVFEFLARQIAKAIGAAITDALEHDHDEAELYLRTGRVSERLLLNRSPRTFLANWNSKALMKKLNPDPLEAPECRHMSKGERGEAKRDWDLSGCPRLRATDPVMTLLDIHRGPDRIGLLVFFAAHPTVLYHEAPLYSGDFIGRAMAILERTDPSGIAGQPPVVGFFNGAEGDIEARQRGFRDFRSVRDKAGSLVMGVRSVLTNQSGTRMQTPVITTRQKVVRAGACCSTDSVSPRTGDHEVSSWGTARLAEKPEFGAAGIGGGEDDRTVLYQLGWREGLRGVAENGQGGKLPALDSQLLPIKLTASFAPPEKFPRELPLTYATLGDLTLAALPAEISTAQADEIRNHLGQHGKFEVIGLANEYTSYAVTPDEYALQDYMGASTVWGPFEGRLFGCEIEQLKESKSREDGTCSVDKQGTTHCPVELYCPGARSGGLQPFSFLCAQLPFLGGTTFGPSAVGERLPSPDDELELVLLDDKHLPKRDLPYFEWQEKVKDKPDEFARAAQRIVRILVERDGHWVPRTICHSRAFQTIYSSPPPDLQCDEADDDRGANFLTIMREAPTPAEPNVRSWAAIWLAPVLEEGDLAHKFYKFEVELCDGTMVQSQPFELDAHGNLASQPCNRPGRIACDSCNRKRSVEEAAPLACLSSGLISCGFASKGIPQCLQ